MDLFIKVYFYDCLSMRFLWWPYNRKPRRTPLIPVRSNTIICAVGLYSAPAMEIYTLLHGTGPPLQSSTRDYYQSIGNIHQHVIIVVGARTVWHRVIRIVFFFLFLVVLRTPYLIYEYCSYKNNSLNVDFYIHKNTYYWNF